MPETEAEALLRSGALYPSASASGPMTGRSDLRRPQARRLLDLLRRRADLHHDLEGRWRRCYREPSHYLHRLDGTDPGDRPPPTGPEHGPRPPDPRRGRGRPAPRGHPLRGPRPARTARLRFDRPRRPAAAGAAARPRPAPRPARPGRVRGTPPPGPTTGARYRSTYGPIPFLPPDCQEAIVLQATLGHSGGRAFGAVPADPLVVRTPDEFATHCRAVAELLGAARSPNAPSSSPAPTSPASPTTGSSRSSGPPSPSSRSPTPPPRPDGPTCRSTGPTARACNCSSTTRPRR